MRIYIYLSSIVIFFFSFVIAVPYIFPQRKVFHYNDDELRKAAISKGMSSVPKTYEDLQKLYQTQTDTLTKDKIDLGKKLFFDESLSENKKTSCNTCHTIALKKELTHGTLLPFLLSKEKTNVSGCTACHTRDQSGVDRFTFAVGTNEDPHLLNTTSILNSSLLKYYGWDGKTLTLNEWIKKDLKNKNRMSINEQELLNILNKENYKTLYLKAFNQNPSLENTTLALSAYIKTLLTRSKFDDFLDGNNEAISEEAKKGLTNFITFGCKGCHTGMSIGGQSLQKFPLRKFARIQELEPNVQLYPELKRIDISFPFENVGDFKGKDDGQIFRVPNLRNVSKTSPYFHNGAIKKLREAVDIMAKHQLGLVLTQREVDEIVEFLRSLDGEIVDYNLENN